MQSRQPLSSFFCPCAITVVSTTHGVDGVRRKYLLHFAYLSPTTNGPVSGDEVRILGVARRNGEEIDPRIKPDVRVTFSVDVLLPVPADVQAAILVAVIQPALTPAGGLRSPSSQMADAGTIPKARTAVPVEWETSPAAGEAHDSLQEPHHQPGGPTRSGDFINNS